MSERITSHPGILDGKPVVAGTRLSVAFLVELIAGGASNDELLAAYPELTVEGIDAALEYAARLLADLEPADGTSSDIEAAWNEELVRRLASVDAGETLESWDAVRDRLGPGRRPKRRVPPPGTPGLCPPASNGRGLPPQRRRLGGRQTPRRRPSRSRQALRRRRARTRPSVVRPREALSAGSVGPSRQWRALNHEGRARA